jgi:hypothetical protein
MPSALPTEAGRYRSAAVLILTSAVAPKIIATGCHLRPSTSRIIGSWHPLLLRFFFQTGGAEPPASGYGKPDRFNRERKKSVEFKIQI